MVDFKDTISAPCLAGDFNQAIFDWEKQGGGPINSNASDAFSACIDACQLLDLGLNGHPFTYQHGDLKERLDMVLCSSSWQDMFPQSSVTHLSPSSSDHWGLWLRMCPGNASNIRHYFKFLSPWIEHDGFEQQVLASWIHSDSWNDNIARVTSNLKAWNSQVFGNIFQKKTKIDQEARRYK